MIVSLGVTKSACTEAVCEIFKMAKTYKKPEADKGTERKTRKCLICSEPFPSEWSGERVCKTCKSKASWRNS